MFNSIVNTSLQLNFIFQKQLKGNLTFDVIFTVVFSPYKYHKTLKNNNLIKRKTQLGAIK